jgi:hypothetical protein
MDYILTVLLKDIKYLWMLVFIMISAGLAKEYNLFAPAFAYVRNTFRSNRFVLVLLSAIGGVLPIEGRVTVSAGLLDSVAPKDGPGRQKMGIIDYLATHHYYMWSPLEKSVIIPIAAFGLTYAAWLGMIAPLLIVSLGFIGFYIYFRMKEEELSIAPGNFKLSQVMRSSLPMFVAIGAYVYTNNYIICFGLLALYYIIITQQWSPKKILGYINWEVVLTVAVVIILGNYFKSEQAYFQGIVKGLGVDPATFIGMLTITAVGFGASFLMGSSSRFVALAVLMAQLFGPQYFLWFFAVDYAGYLLSPTHKCVMIGNRYFGTPLKTYYGALGMWVLLLLITAGTFTFVLN